MHIFSNMREDESIQIPQRGDSLGHVEIPDVLVRRPTQHTILITKVSSVVCAGRERLR